MGILEILESSKMKQFAVILLFCAIGVFGDEEFHGEGTFKCYGDLSIDLYEEYSRDRVDGFLDCQPAWGSPSAPPQGIVADADNGEKWVTVDDKGYGDCTGSIYYVYGDLNLGYCDRSIMKISDGKQTRLFCGYAECIGMMNIYCSMLSGCHGA